MGLMADVQDEGQQNDSDRLRGFGDEQILVVVESLSQLKLQEVWMILHPDLPDL